MVGYLYDMLYLGGYENVKGNIIYVSLVCGFEIEMESDIYKW